MKILIISQKAYPYQGPRAFRTTELAEQLSKVGHDVTLYTIHGSCKYDDYEKKTGVKMKDIKPCLPIFANDDIDRNNVFTRFLSHFLHDKILFPEIELHYKVLSILKKEPKADMLITIAMPHTLHTGAARAKKKRPDLFPKVWVADCGDPFFLNPFMKLPQYMVRWEHSWCKGADFITVPAENSKNGYFPEYWDKIRIIPQGFDFSKTPIANYERNEIPTFIFTGAVYPGIRDIHSFLDYLLKMNRPYKFKLYMRAPLEQKYVEESNHQIEYVIGRSRKEIIMECSKADFLINISNPNGTQTPSKLIDYGVSGRPVLDISSDFREQDSFIKFCDGDYTNRLSLPDLEKYKIENVAKQFVELARNRI